MVTRPLESLADICTVLVSYGADDVSSLHYAVSLNSSSIVAALLSARLKFPDTVWQSLAAVDDETGFMPLHTALYYGYLECCQQLVDAGADVNAVCRDAIFGESGVTALEMAVMRRNKDAIQLLLQSPSCQVDKVGSRESTALLHATARGLNVQFLHMFRILSVLVLIPIVSAILFEYQRNFSSIDASIDMGIDDSFSLIFLQYSIPILLSSCI